MYESIAIAENRHTETVYVRKCGGNRNVAAIKTRMIAEYERVKMDIFL